MTDLTDFKYHQVTRVYCPSTDCMLIEKKKCCGNDAKGPAYVEIFVEVHWDVEPHKEKDVFINVQAGFDRHDTSHEMSRPTCFENFLFTGTYREDSPNYLDALWFTKEYELVFPNTQRVIPQMFFAPDQSGRMQEAGNGCPIRKDLIYPPTVNPWFYQKLKDSPKSMRPASDVANANAYSDDETDTNRANLIVPSPGTPLSPNFAPLGLEKMRPTIDPYLNTAGSVANLNTAGSVASANLYSDNKADTNLSPNVAPLWPGGMPRIDANLNTAGFVADLNTAGSDGADCTVYGCGGVASFMQSIPSNSKRGMPVEFRA
ncbi:hypothetical protein MMC07_005183 [Pseudocyphellaria aurata]|nr:hypothetical protein [Pseudocyphellaria aurata]